MGARRILLDQSRADFRGLHDGPAFRRSDPSRDIWFISVFPNPPESVLIGSELGRLAHLTAEITCVENSQLPIPHSQASSPREASLGVGSWRLEVDELT
jgi:hypothetical protein